MSLYSQSSNQSRQAHLRQFKTRSTLPLLPNSLWKIETGVVKNLTWLEDGSTVILGLWGPGDVVGKALSQVEPYQIECLTAVEATILPVSEWYPLTSVLLSHIQQAEELMVIRRYKKTDIMLVKLLTWLAKRFGREIEQGQLIDLRLTHQDIAEILGSTRVTITRTLSQLEQQGFIERFSLSRLVLREEDLWHYEI
ncbi:MAG TPA: Crp/Fnr family transcriptional regulator [Cyanobacteria bacterium UBA11369]|nr:Crp/Fnr family transcriptional regulator [Cyanobacteria bacterium UBA11371]HBE32996.1 Crp/Fnr family transcriptional regulator [Cyanobacteria bacterium UBA11368]HBE50506.1 Crp/Fnr family transcriptional regulator [Cyanobacteria bacterium UBA11369]